jgi:hypothetical protein
MEAKGLVIEQMLLYEIEDDIPALLVQEAKAHSPDALKREQSKLFADFPGGYYDA